MTDLLQYGNQIVPCPTAIDDRIIFTVIVLADDESDAKRWLLPKETGGKLYAAVLIGSRKYVNEKMLYKFLVVGDSVLYEDFVVEYPPANMAVLLQ